jgi:hypothetical protein
MYAAISDIAGHNAVHPGHAARTHTIADLLDNVGLRQNSNHLAVFAHDDEIGVRFGLRAAASFTVVSPSITTRRSSAPGNIILTVTVPTPAFLKIQ